MRESEDETFGFGVPDHTSWSSFVSTGELGRVLTRACWLVRSTVDLGYRIAVVGRHTVVTFFVEGEPAEVVIEPPDSDRDIDRPLDAVLAGLDAALAEHGRAERFERVVRRGSLHARQRIVLVGGSETLPPIEERTPRRLDEDGSLLGLVAGYVERLAAFAGLAHVTCTPRWVQEPERLTLVLEEKPPGRGSTSRTLELRYQPELEIQPILDSINGALGGDTRHHLYRIAREPGRVGVALLDRNEAAALRKTGDLIEQPAKDTLRALATAGFELEALYGDWRWGVRRLPDYAQRLSVLAGISIGCEVDSADDHSTTVTWIAGDARTTVGYSSADGGLPIVDVLGRAIGQLNRTLGAAGVASRCVVMSGRPQFWGHRMLVLDREWLSRVAQATEVLPGCLEDPELAHVIGVFPPADPETPLPRLPVIEDIVDRTDVLHEDFKCSARPSDMVDVIEQLARFGRVAVEIDPEITDRGEDFVFRVTHRGAATDLALDNSKYVNVGPILEYLNAVLDGRTPRRQLYSFRGGGWSGGVLRASDEQAAQLRALGYIG